MWVGLLGPLLVRDGAVELPAGSGKQRVVLAALGLRPGRVVSVAELCGILWDDAPPPAAPVTARNHVKGLRRVLGPVVGARVVTRAPGYLLDAGPGEVDVLVFGGLCEASAAAARAADWPRAAGLLDEALALWRGPPLADVPSQVLQRERVLEFEQLRLQVVEQRVEALLNLGRHAELVPELHALVAEHPLREAFHGQLMTALYRAGCQADALAAYRRAHRTLAAELGVDPGPQLRDLHQRILTGDPGLITVPPVRAVRNTGAAVANGHGPPGNGNAAPGAAGPWPPAAAGSESACGPAAAGSESACGPAAAGSEPARRPAAAGSAVIPRQLPAGVPGFAARQAELELLSGALAGLANGTGTATISAVRGMAGVGKTALAVHWAHQVAERFPDGLLYANLRGYAPSAEPAKPAAIVRSFLDALGVLAERIPASPEAQAGLYRSLLAGRRVLIVLDNARDEDQVRPLLPGSSGCLVVVTSRARLTGLAAAEGARLISLDVLTGAESVELLGRRIGPGRVAAELAAVNELAGLCGGLPLALAIVAARAADHPGFPLAALAAELRAQRLDALDAGDTTMSVRTVLSWSYRQLGPAAARLFRLLGLHPGPDISALAAANLAGAQLAETRRLLAELCRAHLVTEQQPGRYALHDLLRAYAAEQSRLSDSETGRREATGRVLSHYLHTASAAVSVLHPFLFTPIGPQPGISPEEITDVQHALDWFDAEHEVLVSAVELAASTGFDTCAWRLAWFTADFFFTRGYWHQSAVIQRIAMAAATRDGDPAGQVEIRRMGAWISIRLANYAEASAQFTACLELDRKLGNRRGEAWSYQALCVISTYQGHYADALGHAEQALAVFRSISDRVGEAGALNDLGWCHAQLGHYEQARTLCRQSLSLHRELGNPAGEGAALDSLGYTEHQLGNHSEAAAHYQAALGLFRELGNYFFEASALSHIGDSRAAAGDSRAAHESWQQALKIYDRLSHPDADQVRAKLRQNGPAHDA